MFCVLMVFVYVFSFLQYLPLPEVPGGLGTGVAGRLRAGVQVRVSLAVLALHPECVRLLQIPRPGECLLIVALLHFHFQKVYKARTFKR